jgi:hypothetical protein
MTGTLAPGVPGRKPVPRTNDVRAPRTLVMQVRFNRCGTRAAVAAGAADAGGFVASR